MLKILNFSKILLLRAVDLIIELIFFDYKPYFLFTCKIFEIKKILVAKKMNIKKKLSTLGQRYTKNADFILKVLDQCDIKEGAKVLDIGTGRGIMTIILALKNYQVITGEPEGANWGNWKESAKKVDVLDLIKFKPLRAEDLPFSDNSFDAIFLYTSFHHISTDNREKALEEILRVLKREGTVVIIELTEKGVKRLRKKHPSHPNPADPRDFAAELPREFQMIKGKLLNAYLYQKK